MENILKLGVPYWRIGKHGKAEQSQQYKKVHEKRALLYTAGAFFTWFVNPPIKYVM